MSLADLLRDLSESLKPPEDKPRTHACYYVVEGQDPERCVLEYGRPQDCVFATRLVAEGKDQTTCEYWRPLRAQAPAAQPAESRTTTTRTIEWHKPQRQESDSRKADSPKPAQRKPESQSETPVALKEPEPVATAPINVQAIIERLQEREALIQAVITREILEKPLALRRGRRPIR